MKRKEVKFSLRGVVSIVMVGLIFMIMSSYLNNFDQNLLSYTDFQNKLANNEIDKVILKEDSNKVEVITKDNGYYYTSNPNTDDFKEMLLKNDVVVKENLSFIKTGLLLFKATFSLVQLAFFVFGVILMITIYNLVAGVEDLVSSLPSISIKESGISGSPRMQMSQNGSSDIEPVISDVKFEDVKGIDEAMKDLKFVVDFLKNPDKYHDMGARIHKGVILYGPPGTGKTLTAKAIAGEAGVPFFSVNGSEFMDTYVGVGPKKVRELYKTARMHAPCIVFIDEIDSIGGQRTSGTNSDEKDRTVNQLLSELDGFSDTAGVITIVATNRLKDLDSALIRPGRFDKHLAIPLPDKQARLELLELHSKNKKLAKEVDLSKLSETIVGFSGAGIEALLNEAAFLAVVNDKKEITNEEIERALFKQIMQGDIKDGQSTRSKEELELVAWHEAGHALLTKLLTKDKVNKVTILASTSGAGGVTFRTPENDSLYSKEYLEHTVAISYGGRIAEHLLLGDESKITIGASNDIEKASITIKKYITDFGMSDRFGLINPDYVIGQNNLSNDMILNEAFKISERIYNDSFKLLEEHYELLKMMSEELLKHETLEDEDLNKIMDEYFNDSEQLSFL